MEQGRILNEIPAGHIALSGRRVRLGIAEVSTGHAFAGPSRPELLPATGSKRLYALKQLLSERIRRELMIEAQLNLRC